MGRTLFDRANGYREALMDAVRFARFSGPPDSAVPNELDDTALETQLVKDYHRVEKGLSLREPKRPFGAAVEARLARLLPAGLQSDSSHAAAAAGHGVIALDALRQWNDESRVSDEVAPVPAPFAGESPATVSQRFTSRRSVRDYDLSRVVPSDVLDAALDCFQSAPSVCNRQAARLHLYRDRGMIERLLELQGGGSGFSRDVPYVAVLTARLSLFSGAGERNQAWIDGSLAGMAFVSGLHEMGVSSCMLNWSKRNVHSAKLRNLTDIPEEEEIMCLIAFGYAREGARVARSPRRRRDDVVVSWR
ncbi:nitroreductase family protein [Serinibacter salmoneus]|nr:nitroreductase family protein [Serinibacter salmoneus]